MILVIATGLQKDSLSNGSHAYADIRAELHFNILTQHRRRKIGLTYSLSSMIDWIEEERIDWRIRGRTDWLTEIWLTMFQWVRIFSIDFVYLFTSVSHSKKKWNKQLESVEKKSKRSLKGHVFGKQVTWFTYNLLSVNVGFLPHHFSWALGKV